MKPHKIKLIEAIGYMRTSSATNDSELRQRKAIEGYAKAAGMVIVDWFYDKAVRGADAITERPGFAAMLKPHCRQWRADDHRRKP